MSNSYICVTLLSLSVLIVSCSTSQQVTETPTETKAEPESDSFYPAWYSNTSEFTRTDSTFTAYGLAVGVDSNEAVQKAVTKAKANFEQHISSQLESIRTDAAEELNNRNIDSPDFIFALRNVEASLSDALKISEKVARRNEKFSSYQGFASVTISREELINSIGNQLGSNQETWKAIQSSQAFEQL